jgi:hypothetical protein
MSTLPARPRVAALDYSRDLSPARQALLSRFPFVVLSFLQAQLSAAALPATLAFLQALRNAGTQVAQYTILNEFKDPQTTSDETYSWWQQMNANAWWALNAGAKVQWTTAFGNFEANPTRETQPDAQGRHVPQARADWDWSNRLQYLAPLVGYVFCDNTMFQPRVTADYNCDGTSEAPAQAAQAFRTGYAEFFAALQARGFKVMGNSDCDTSAAGGYGCSLSKPELKGVAQGAFLEGVAGKSYSLEGFAGVAAVLKYIRSAINATQPGSPVLVNVYADLPASVQLARYGLCISMLEDGLYCLNAASNQAPLWLDEYDQPIGDPTDGPQSAPTLSGCFVRRYSNGMVLVNPTSAAITVDLTGQGLRRFSGSQDPVVNNGQAVSQVTLQPKDGVLLLKL